MIPRLHSHQYAADRYGRLAKVHRRLGDAEADPTVRSWHWILAHRFHLRSHRQAQLAGMQGGALETSNGTARMRRLDFNI